MGFVWDSAGFASLEWECTTFRARLLFSIRGDGSAGANKLKQCNIITVQRAADLTELSTGLCIRLGCGSFIGVRPIRGNSGKFATYCFNS